MAFDLSTAKPVDDAVPRGFDLATARPDEQGGDPFAWQTDEQRAEAEALAASPDKGGFLNFMTGADRTLDSVPRVYEEQVFPSTVGGMKDAVDATLGTALTFDPEARKNIYTKQLNESGVEHKWVQDQFGNNVLLWKDAETGEERQGVLDPQGFNLIDLSATLGAVGVGKLAEVGKRMGAGLLGLGARQPTVTGALASGAGTGAAESVVMDAGANVAGAEIPGGDMAANAAMSAGAGAAFDSLLGPGRAKATQALRDTSPTAVPADEAQAKATLAALRQTGLADDVMGPQLSNDPYQLMVQRTLFSLPGSSRKIATRLEQQDQAAYKAFMDWAADIAPAQALDSADAQTRSFAKSYMDGLRGEASKAARPFYDAAYSVDLDPAVREALLSDDAVAAAFKEVSSNPAYSRQIKDYPENSLMPFDLVKRRLKDQADELAKQGKNNEARSIRAAHDNLVESLADASPDYRKALETYSQAMGPFNQADMGTVGKLSRVSEQKTEQVLKHVFSNPDSVLMSRKMVMQMDPSGKTWEGLTRRFVEDKISQIRGILADESGEMFSSKGNVPRNLYDKIWPNQQAKETLNAALSAEQRRRLEAVMLSVNAFARGRGAGSDTAMRGPLLDDLGRGRAQAAFQAITSPIKYLDDKFMQNRVMRRSAALADVIMRTDDKALNAEIKKLMEIDPRTPQFARGLEAVLGRWASGDTMSQEEDQ